MVPQCYSNKKYTTLSAQSQVNLGGKILKKRKHKQNKFRTFKRLLIG